MNQIPERLAAVGQRIADAAARADREPGGVQLLAVSKKKPARDVLAAWSAGQRLFGENYVQEALEKIRALSAYPIEWHYIGRLQSNKLAEIAQHFSWVHGLDRLSHAEKLARLRPADAPPINVCIQVNLSNETSKGGIGEAELAELATAVAALSGLKLRGLMTMPDPACDEEQTRETFRRLRQLLAALDQQGLALDTLSMGMSGDLELAIAEGASIVRVGTDIFGPR